MNGNLGFEPGIDDCQSPTHKPGVIDQGDDAHAGSAEGTLKRIDFADFLNQSCQMARCVAGCFVNRRDAVRIALNSP